jgi:hypothetical protein
MGGGAGISLFSGEKGLRSAGRHERTSDKSMISEDITRKPEISLKEDGNGQ